MKICPLLSDIWQERAYNEKNPAIWSFILHLKIREFLVFRMRFRGIETQTRIDCPKLQRFLQPAHSFVIDFGTALFPFSSQMGNSQNDVSI